ncbi:MAG: PEPxxWA-CTERM sorting domain-containing protein [Phenylobacterium sp.]|nr:PEPxxWA-CTERM sorting domain-containing protein [Phenylobacterium sp.]MDP3853922.1 PEPxxWA-CTERM sorting domain-containing protein [Phenylobacterium sp.]
MKQFALLLAGAVLVAAQPAAAAVTQIVNPDLAYTSSTTLLPITAADFAPVSSVTDGVFTVTFNPGQARTVGSGWATWGSPPDTEGSTPKIVYTSGQTSITFLSSGPMSVFGFEAEGNPFDFRNFTVDYYLGGVLQGSISRSISGNAGARLLAASGTFDKAVVSSDVDFAFAQVRYSLGSAVPEPATWAMMIVGFGAVGGAVRNARRRQTLAFA